MHEKIALFSKKDTAGRNIARLLQEMNPDAAVTEVAESTLQLQDFPTTPDVCVVASKHRSDSGLPVLTAHAPGNFGDAAYGGRTRELGIAPALYLHEAVKLLKEQKEKRKLDYEVCLEATHHGPTSLGFPIMFLEVGSGEIQWTDLEACQAAADAIRELLAAEPEDHPTAVGFGGGHYCRKFSALEEYALGHICPKHGLGCLDEEMIRQMVEKTVPRPKVALVEKKGLGEEKSKVLELLEGSGLAVVKV